MLLLRRSKRKYDEKISKSQPGDRNVGSEFLKYLSVHYIRCNTWVTLARRCLRDDKLVGLFVIVLTVCI